MSLETDGVWKSGVWAFTVWGAGVWYESGGGPSPAPAPAPSPAVVQESGGGGWTPHKRSLPVGYKPGSKGFSTSERSYVEETDEPLPEQLPQPVVDEADREKAKAQFLALGAAEARAMAQEQKDMELVVAAMLLAMME